MERPGIPQRTKTALKRLAARIMRPGLQEVYAHLYQIENELAASAAALAEKNEGAMSAGSAKYESELGFWRKLIKEGMSEERFGRPFEALFGQWQRDRLLLLGEYVGVGAEGIDEWCRGKSVVEIGAGPYPAVAAASHGWKRAVAVDPLAKGYAEEGMLPPECRGVVYIEATGETIPLAARFADLVIIENCLDHVSDPHGVVAEMNRLLKPGGLVWLFVDLSTYSDHMHPHPMNEGRVLSLMSEFELVRGGVTDTKAHPEAYAGYRGLWKKAGEGAGSNGVVVARIGDKVLNGRDGG
jgi:SAM-dependent methyltransferase